MLAVPFLDITLLPPRTARWLPLGLSALLHLLLALVWLGFPAAENKAPAEQAIQVDIAAEPLRPAPPPPPNPAAAVKPPAPAATELGKPIPQLEDGVLAQRSSSPKLKSDAAPVPSPQPRAEVAPKPKKPEPPTQNERDFVLSQVLRHWRPPSELAARDHADVRVSVIVDANGYFDEIYDARRPWNPAAVFDGYTDLPPDDVRRRTVDAFYRAIRQAQPVRLPPALKAKAPFRVPLDFRFKDAR